MYFALLLAGLAVPTESLKQSRVSSRRWRLVGYFLLLNGLSWIVSDVLQIGIHSQTIRRKAETQMLEDNFESSLEDANFVLEKALRSRPLDWRLHHERGSGNFLPREILMKPCLTLSVQLFVSRYFHRFF